MLACANCSAKPVTEPEFKLALLLVDVLLLLLLVAVELACDADDVAAEVVLLVAADELLCEAVLVLLWLTALFVLLCDAVELLSLAAVLP